VPVEENITVAYKMKAVLQLSALAYPVPTVCFWQKQNYLTWTNITSNDRVTVQQAGLNFTLAILNVSDVDLGMYKLLIFNEIGSYEQLYQVGVEGKVSCCQ
jgi:ABC-type molybdate transport system substrate-binding protein